MPSSTAAVLPMPLQVVRQRPRLAVGVLLAALVLLAAILAPWLAPHDPLRPLPGVRLGTPQPPASGRPLGTDPQGRDVLSRLLHGARLSLTVGLGATLLAMTLALTVGTVAGYAGGWVDGALMRFTDMVMAFPPILLALAAAAVLPHRTPWTLLLIIGFINWAGAARVFRSEVLSLRERPYIEAARAMGATPARIVFRHVLPQLAPTLAAMASLGVANIILMDTGLAFLNVGIPLPAPTWGGMLQDGQRFYSSAPWLAVWPGLAVFSTVAAFNLVAYDLQPGRADRGG